jgi:PKHD-type hydroxylase
MILELPAVLSAEQVGLLRSKLEMLDAPWVDGRATAGHQGAPVKQNLQIDEGSTLARELGDVVLAALERHPLFLGSVLPRVVYPPMFNRYENGMHFGNHVDGALRRLPGTRRTIRTDVSATLFLASPDTYDGGELLIEEGGRTRAVKLAAGDLVLYPTTSVHRVEAVTRGVRLACFFWVQSTVRDEAQRALLFDLDRAIQTLNEQHAAHPAMVQLTGTYHNLLRMWADV